MSEMIERVAKAIASMRYATPWDELMSHQRDQFHGMARVAIDAMRSPTVDMLAAAFPCEHDEKFTHEDKTLGSAVCLKLGGWEKIGIMGGEPIKQAAFLARDYRLMIDAALSVPSEEHS